MMAALVSIVLAGYRVSPRTRAALPVRMKRHI